MKETVTEYMGKEEERMVDILRSFDWKHHTAKCAVYMVHHKEAHSRDVEQAMDLRQPEVSIGMRELLECGLITIKEENDGKYRGRGRPRIRYCRKQPADAFCDTLIRTGKEKAEELKEKMDTYRKTIQEVAE